MKTILPLLRQGLLCLAVLLLPACKDSDAPARKPKFYQSPMHPWITSDKPGNCTICGMQLAPVYEDQAALDDSSAIEVSSQTARVLGLATSPVILEPLQRSVRVSGILEDDERLHQMIAAFFDGRIEDVYVQQVGEKVKAGQPLASIYSPELLYVVREYQNAARGRNEALTANSRHRLIQYGLSSAQVERLATMPRDRFAIDILAPADGTILERNAYPGQYVKNGERLFETGDLSRLWFKAEVYERDLPFIRIGQKAEISTPAVPGRTFEGIVTFLDPNFDPATRSTKIRIEVDNPPSGNPGGYDRLLPHRAYADAVIVTDTAPVLTVPRSALIRDGRREVVYLETAPGQFEMRGVTAGLAGDERVEIVSGLSEGDRVATRGNLMIDAEVQLRLGASLIPGEGKPLPAEWKTFLEQLAAVSAELAADQSSIDVDLGGLLPEGPAGAPFAAASEAFAKLPPVPKTNDITRVREVFFQWSDVAAGLVLALQRDGFEVPVRAFECPMTGSAFPGAPQHARWIQTPAAARNPYFGASMLECGSEVQP